MRASLKVLQSIDLIDFETDLPEDVRHFGVRVAAGIGPSDDDGTEWFYFLVCSPSWITDELADTRAKWGRAVLLMREYSSTVVREELERLCRSFEAPSWEQIAESLARFMGWEFD
jgi:hypothetical protein